MSTAVRPSCLATDANRRAARSPVAALAARVAALAAAWLLVAATGLLAQDVPEVVRDVLDRAQRQQEAGRLDDALESYLEARELGPQVPEVHLGLGAVYVGLGQNEEALEAFVQGLENDADSRDLLFNAAVIALRLERFDEALGFVDRALAGHARDVELRLVHAAVLDRLGRGDQALRALEAADDLAPETPQILFRLGNQLHQQGRSEQAVAAYRRAIAEDRSMLRAHYNLGAVLLELGRFDEALDAYRVALAPFDRAFRQGELPDARHAPAYANLGAIHTQRREWQQALEAYDKSLRLEPNHADRLYNRGFVSYQQGELAAAGRDYRAALELEAALPLAYLHLAQIARRSGDCAAATERLEKGMEYFGTDPSATDPSAMDPSATDPSSTEQRLAALELLAFCYAELDQPQRAEAAFRDVLAASPANPDLLLGLGRLLRRQGRLAEALQRLEQADALRPGHLPTGLELLAVAEAGGDAETQSRLAAALLANHPQQEQLWRVRWSLALLMLRQGQLAEARGHLAALGDQAPESERPRVAALEAMTAAALGDLDTARAKLRVASERGDSAAAAAVLDVLDGGGREAVLALERVTPTDGPWTPYHSDLGVLWWSLGVPGRAGAYLAIAEAAGDASPAVLAARGDLAGDAEVAAAYFARALAACADPPQLQASADLLRVRLPARESGLCGWIEGRDRRARLQLEIRRLAAGGGDAAVADQVLAAGDASAEERALAHYLRGTTRTKRGLNGAPDLRAALGGALPAGLTAAARLYLGVALGRADDLASASRELEAARAAGGAIGAAATLNLAILIDDKTDDGRRALELYEAYLRSGGPRSAEVAGWAEGLRRIYR